MPSTLLEFDLFFEFEGASFIYFYSYISSNIGKSNKLFHKNICIVEYILITFIRFEKDYYQAYDTLKFT